MNDMAFNTYVAWDGLRYIVTVYGETRGTFHTYEQALAHLNQLQKDNGATQ